MKSTIAIRHVAFEDLDTFAPVLEAAGYDVRYREAADGLPEDDGAGMAADLVIVLGGPIGAYEERAYPFLAKELRLIERRLNAQRRVLGICLGAQLVARALGARVYPGLAKEIGWAPVALTAAGEASCLRHLTSDLAVLNWHGDTFDLPRGAVRLASSALYENQAFALDAVALALQFHLEVSPARLEHWYVGHACEIAATPGIDVESLRRAGEVHGPRLEGVAAQVLADWLNDGQA
jgi:GMP synthase (glutamine-hydrolysing)